MNISGISGAELNKLKFQLLADLARQGLNLKSSEKSDIFYGQDDIIKEIAERANDDLNDKELATELCKARQAAGKLDVRDAVSYFNKVLKRLDKLF